MLMFGTGFRFNAGKKIVFDARYENQCLRYQWVLSDCELCKE